MTSVLRTKSLSFSSRTPLETRSAGSALLILTFRRASAAVFTFRHFKSLFTGVASTPD